MGPLINLWCMRFEAKHMCQKPLANVAKVGNEANRSQKRHGPSHADRDITPWGPAYRNGRRD